MPHNAAFLARSCPAQLEVILRSSHTMLGLLIPTNRARSDGYVTGKPISSPDVGLLRFDAVNERWVEWPVVAYNLLVFFFPARHLAEVAIEVHPIRRVREYHIGLLTRQQPRHLLSLRAVSAQQP